MPLGRLLPWLAARQAATLLTPGSDDSAPDLDTQEIKDLVDAPMTLTSKEADIAAAALHNDELDAAPEVS